MNCMTIKRGRPRLSDEEILKRHEQLAEKSRIYSQELRADDEKRKLQYDRVKACKAKNAEIYKEKNKLAVRAFRARRRAMSCGILDVLSP